MTLPPTPSRPSIPALSTAGSEASRTFAVTFVPLLPGQDGFAVTSLVPNQVAPGCHGPSSTLPAWLSAAGSARPPAPCLLSTRSREQPPTGDFSPAHAR